MSSQDGPNRSRRTPRTSQQPRRSDPPTRRNQTWDVDPAEIDRYLSGRPSRSEESTDPTPGRSTSGTTADQLSRLQNAVGRRPASGQSRSGSSQPSGQRPASRRPPEPDVYDDEGYEADDVSTDAYTATDEYGEPEAYRYENETYASNEEDAWEEPVARQPSRRAAEGRSPQRQRTQRRYDPEPVEVYPDEDDELYNDDPYLGYEDDQIDRRPPRRARTTRQRPAISKPNLPSISLPKSVTDSPLLADMPSLVMIGMAIVSVALMSFLVSDRISVLGDTIATHVSASGDPENIRGRDAIWNIPLMAGMLMLMNVAAAWIISRIDGFAARFLLASGLLVHFVAWVALFKYLWE